MAFFSDILMRDFDGANKTMFQLIDRIPESEYHYMFFCGMSSSNNAKHVVKEVPTLTIPSNNTYKVALPNLYKCDVTYVPTKQIAKELEQSGVSSRNFKLWQRGINTSLFSPQKRDRLFMQELTGNDYPTLLFVSRLVWEKNLETLFEIYDRVQELGLKVNFLVAGDGVAEKVARSRMKNAFFLGYLEHEALAAVYASSDIFVFPSISEAYGNVVIEAMASGCVPVIAQGGGSQALVEDGVTGFLCEPNEADEYIENIKKLLNTPFLRKKMQAEGLKFTATLSWENLSKEYFNDIEILANYSRNLQRKESV
ncbi:MAG: glycosyltransferase [Dehalococcoidia bacterium]|nr:glycosyltransferase [Dehalococcoidia bacterium]